MSKKLLSAVIACIAVMAFAGGAWAVDANVVLREGGASAQGDFLALNGAEFLSLELGCDRVCRNSIPGDNTSFIIKGFNCDWDGETTPDDTITLYVQGIGSSFGCNNAPGSQNAPGWIDESTCDFSAAAGCDGGIDLLNNCNTNADKLEARLHVGCSDIQCTSIGQTTTGYNDGRKGFNANQPSEDFGTAGGIPPTSISPTADMVFFNPFVVPFGFVANDHVTKTRCVAPVVSANALNSPAYGTCNGGQVNPRIIGSCDSGVRSGLGCTVDEHCPISGDLLWDFFGAQCVPGSQRCIPDDPIVGSLPGTCDANGEDCSLSTQYQLNPNRFIAGQPWLQLVPNSCPPIAGAVSGDESSECVGFFKCVGVELADDDDPNDLQRTCVGGVNLGQPCDTARDCPVDRTLTSCVARPIDNLSRMQALLLFAGQVKNWQDFGPWYPDLPVALCMRHGGSGTHATMDLRVMRGDRLLATVSKTLSPNDPTGAAAPRPVLPILWHYKSSTTLTEDCVEYYHGGVGYVDADKALNNDFTSNVHHLKHEGVEPVRQKIYFGEYPYWGAASCYYDNDGAAGLSQDQKDLAAALLNWIASQTERFEYPTNLFWAAGSEMTVGAPNDFAYPSKN